MEHVTIRAISYETRSIIAEMLNPIMPISTTDDGLPRDWRGLFELCKLDQKYMGNLWEHTDPSMKVLKLWQEADKENSTVDVFLTFLERLDRFDIVYDVTPLIEKDVENYKKEEHDAFEPEYELYTIDDISRHGKGLEPQMYDAFVLFAEDDINFAIELIDTMESQYNLKLCTKDRDIVACGDEHEVMIKLIKHRCNKLVVVLSPAFMDSSSHRFFLRFGQGMHIDLKQDKVIPCICKRFDPLPAELVGYVMLDYTRATFWNFWERLYNSIKRPGKINRTQSHPQTRQKKRHGNQQKAVEERDTLRPIGQVVKFSSMVNLNSLAESEKAIKDQALLASPSVNSLGSCSEKSAVTEKKIKSKIKWLKKILPKNNLKVKATT